MGSDACVVHKWLPPNSLVLVGCGTDGTFLLNFRSGTTAALPAPPQPLPRGAR
jgi:hypothetical protein